jgi:hypothetical protein
VVGAFTLSLVVHKGEGVNAVTATVVVIVLLCLVCATVHVWKACLVVSSTYVESVGLMFRKRILYSEVKNITKALYPAVQSERSTIWIFPAFEHQPEILAFIKRQVKHANGEEA